MSENVKLHEFDEDEWWDVCRELRPDIARAEYEAMWDEFMKIKRYKELQ